MNPMLILAAATAGGVGAVARFIVDGLIRRSTLPWGTIIINLSGSFLLGLLTGFGVSQFAPAAWVTIFGIGFLGGYTTFSTASVETVTLLRERRIGAALWNAIGVLVIAVALAACGLWVGTLLGTH